MMEVLRVRTERRTQLVDVTEMVLQVVAKAGVVSGVCYVFVPHTTAGVMINEHFDPDVAGDLEGVFDRLVPHAGPYRHAEGKLALGQWQGIFFCEFDGPRERKMWVKILK